MGKTSHKVRGLLGVRRTCGKWGYGRRAQAERSRQAFFAKSGERLYVYGCVKCGGFHLTSQEKYR